MMTKEPGSITKINVYRPVNVNFASALKEKHKELEPYDIPKVFEEFNKYILQTITESRDGVLMPCYLGNLFVGVYPVKSNKYTLVKNVAKFVDRTRDGFGARIVYSTSHTSGRFHYCRYWGLEPSMPAKHTVSVAFREDWKKYIVIPNIRFIKALTKTSIKTQVRKKLQAQELETYNEFDFT